MSIISSNGFLLNVELSVGDGSPFSIRALGLIEDDTMTMKLGVFIAVIVVVKDSDLSSITLQQFLLSLLFSLVENAVLFHIVHRGTDSTFMGFKNGTISHNESSNADAFGSREGHISPRSVLSFALFSVVLLLAERITLGV